MKFILIVILCVLFSGCGALVPASDAVNAMEALGFEDVKVDGPNFIFTAFRGCGRDDDAVFTAVGTKNGKKVSATVCCGAFFKGCTVRF